MSTKTATVTKMKVKVVSIGKLQVFNDGDFQKRELIGEAKDGDYTNIFCFEFIGDKVSILDNIIPGTDITVSYNIRCRKFEKDGKEPMYFTSLQGWRVEI